MSIGVYNGYLFIINQNEKLHHELVTPFRLRNLFNNPGGLFATVGVFTYTNYLPSNKLLKIIAEENLWAQPKAVNDGKNKVIYISTSGEIYQIFAAESEIDAVLPGVYQPYWGAVAIGSLKHCNNFTLHTSDVFGASEIFNYNSPDEIGIEEYLKWFARHSRLSARINECADVYYIPLSELPECFKLQESGSYSEIEAKFTHLEIGEISIRDIPKDQVEIYSWESLNDMKY